MIGDLHRWLIRQGAKNVRKEIGGQVRRTFGGGRNSTADVWDTVTNEIPPAEGEAPECQWCPICRAARRMRESGPGIGGQLSGAGEAVASAVQDAISALDGLLSKTGGGNAQRDREPQRPAPQGTWGTATDQRTSGAAASVTEASGAEASRTEASSTEESSTEASGTEASGTEASDAEAPQANSDPGTRHDGQGHEPDDRS